MALSKKALQLKREKKKKKRQAKGIGQCASTAVSYNRWPVMECWMPVDLWEKGIGQVVVARHNNLGAIAAGVYLLDVFCLGVKDCFVRQMDSNDYQDLLATVKMSCGELQRVEPGYIHTLIYKAEEYARQFGFKPHSDFAKARKLLGAIPLDNQQTFTFGRENKPCYIQGPYESPVDVKKIIKTLELNAGADNYHFLLEAPDPDLLIEYEEEVGIF